MGHFAHGFKWENGRIQPSVATPFQWFLGDLPSGIYLLKLSEITRKEAALCLQSASSKRNKISGLAAVQAPTPRTQ